MESLPAKRGDVPSCLKRDLEGKISKEDVIRMFQIYAELAHTAGWARGQGAYMDDPSINVIDSLIEFYTEAMRLPFEIRMISRDIFEEVEDQILFCAHNEQTLLRVFGSQKKVDEVKKRNYENFEKFVAWVDYVMQDFIARMKVRRSGAQRDGYQAGIFLEERKLLLEYRKLGRETR